MPLRSTENLMAGDGEFALLVMDDTHHKGGRPLETSKKKNGSIQMHCLLLRTKSPLSTKKGWVRHQND